MRDQAEKEKGERERGMGFNMFFFCCKAERIRLTGQRRERHKRRDEDLWIRDQVLAIIFLSSSRH